jgi:competence protein ComEC
VKLRGRSRPLALAGAVLLLAALGGAYAPPAFLLPASLLVVVAACRAGLIGLIVIAAAAAGLKGGCEARAVEASVRSSPFRARPPPRLARASLLVERCGEDPLRERAWLVGRNAEGTGLLCAWPGELPEALGPGARVRVAGRLSVPRQVTNPGERDRAAALAREGILARLYLGEVGNLKITRAGGTPWGRALRRTRRRGAQRLLHALPPRDAGLAVALLFGWRSGISDADRLRFERTGTLHLLAISGLHLLLVAGAVHGLTRRLGCGPRSAAAIALIVCLLYVPVAGAGSPVRRAAAVLVVYGIALARGRVPDAASALGGAACLVILQDAEEVRRAGFWLSFAAAAGIALHAGRWRERWSVRHRLLARFPAVRQDRRWRLRAESHLLAALPISLAAWCATTPLVAWHFGLVTPWAPITNLAAAPFVTLLMPVNFAIACGASLLAPLSSAICSGLRISLDAFDALPAACVFVAPPAMAAIAIWYLGFALLAGRPRSGLAAMCAALLLAWPSPNPQPPSMTVLDVGHGQAILLRDRFGRAALVDAGSSSRPRVGSHVLRPALRAHGIARLDLVVCTHADHDHWNGLLNLLGRVPIDTLAVGPDAPGALCRRASRRGSTIEAVRTGALLWEADGIRVRVIDDGRLLPGASGNERSVALLVELGGARILLPADRETTGIEALLRSPLLRCDVLLAPHHGSANDAATRLGARTRPEWLIVSTGAGFADEATLRRYDAQRIWITERDGAVVLEPRGARGIAVRAPSRRSATIRPP